MNSNATLLLETDLGVIEVAVHVGRAPVTAAYVRQLVDSGWHHSASFYRSTTLGRPERQPLVQGGPLAPVVLDSVARSPDIVMLPSIETTDSTGITHRAGTVSLARDLDRTGRGLPELFICLDDHPELDAGGRSEPDGRGFPAFGTVTSGNRDRGGDRSPRHQRQHPDRAPPGPGARATRPNPPHDLYDATRR